MARGTASEVGTERIAPNGYTYIKEPQGWRLKHHVIAEKHVIKRPLLPTELVRFKDLDRTNLDPSNIEVLPKGVHSRAKRLAEVERKLEEWGNEYYHLTGKVYVFELRA